MIGQRLRILTKRHVVHISGSGLQYENRGLGILTETRCDCETSGLYAPVRRIHSTGDNETHTTTCIRANEVSDMHSQVNGANRDDQY